ncbi:MAG: DNA-directed RNA polymerase subunit B'' [Candidatus Nanoarchaeia archaeon]|nr:DNA-directed RNA polymerase subunit B'' [Candidatus Nanoarchaeia archaeon]
MNKGHFLIKKYFDDNSFIQSNIESFDHFIDYELQRIIEEVGEIIPTIIPSDMNEFKIKFEKVWITKPSITEADGSKRDVYPCEARLRMLTYSAPLMLKVSTYIDGMQRETFTTEIGRIPIMVKSKYCHLNGLKREELISKMEDPTDTGGYFIINGNERVLITVEDLASNKLFIQQNKTGPSKYSAKLFSEQGAYRIPHTIEQMKDGMIYLSFTRFKRVPIIIVIKALGLIKDQDITKYISKEKEYDDIFINLFDSMEVRSQKDALEFLSKRMGMVQPEDIKLDRVKEQLDKYLLPHLGITDKSRLVKAYTLCKLIKKFFMVSKEGLEPQDKDHYANKKLKLPGDLLSDLFRVNMRILVGDILYNYQRLVKRGKFSTVKNLIRDKLLTSRIQSALATGTWVGGRKGVSQNIIRDNYLSSLSHLQRIASLLSSTQENFEARALHPTHWGRLCAIETPEGTSIGLRKNLALLASVTQEELHEEKIKKALETMGVEFAK